MTWWWIVAVFGAFLFGVGVGGALDLSKTAAERRARRTCVELIRLAKADLHAGAITVNGYRDRSGAAAAEYHATLVALAAGRDHA